MARTEGIRICLAAVMLTALCSMAAAQSGESFAGGGACNLVVNIDGFRNDKGAAGGALFKSPDGWPENNNKAYQLTHSTIAGSHATLHFDSLPAGRYAVAVIHDENSNKKLDRNILGIPKEGFGFTNNPLVGYSVPSFDAAAIKVGCPETVVQIHLIYK